MTSGTTAPLQTSAPEFQYAAISSIVPSATNPRKTFDPTYIGELAASMREVGVIEPLIVRPIAGEQLEIVAGECRYRAAKIADIVLVPVRIRPYTDEQALEVQVIENLHRKDLHPLEEADGYRQLMAGGKHDAAWIASRVGLSVKYVYDRIRLLSLIKDAQDLFRENRITAGHAILLARLSAADQKRAITGDDALFEREGLPFNTDEKDPRKPVSVREFDLWIAENVRFNAAKDADPMIFPETALRLDQARERNAKVVAITHDHYIQEEARSDAERTYGPQSWKRADGKEKSQACAFSVLGVIAAGDGRGQAFDVCTAKEKCKTHWAQWQKDRAKRAAGGTPSSGPGSVGGRAEKERDRWKREEEKRQKEQQRYEAFKARFKKAAPSILKAFAEKIRKTPAHAGTILGGFLFERLANHDYKRNGVAVRDHMPLGKTAEQLVRHLVFLDIYQNVTDEWAGPREIPKISDAFGIDITKILDEVAPVTKPGPVATCRKCGCTEAKACAGGCSWTQLPDPKTGKGLCTKCAISAAVRGSKPAKKRPTAAARA